MQAQNEALKSQVETLNHVQAKLVAKSKRYRDIHKDHLEGQMGMYKPGEVPSAEQLAVRQASRESTRNKDGELGGKQSVASMGKESAVSLPDEEKIQAELNQLIESEDEDGDIVNEIEGAQNVRLQAEKEDNLQLKRQVTSL